VFCTSLQQIVSLFFLSEILNRIYASEFLLVSVLHLTVVQICSILHNIMLRYLPDNKQR
jgi:hypothetical protein